MKKQCILLNLILRDKLIVLEKKQLLCSEADVQYGGWQPEWFSLEEMNKTFAQKWKVKMTLICKDQIISMEEHNPAASLDAELQLTQHFAGAEKEHNYSSYLNLITVLFQSCKVPIQFSVIGSDKVIRVVPESERETQILRAAFSRLKVSLIIFIFFFLIFFEDCSGLTDLPFIWHFKLFYYMERHLCPLNF